MSEQHGADRFQVSNQLLEYVYAIVLADIE
jgi:hypothetical protein